MDFYPELPGTQVAPPHRIPRPILLSMTGSCVGWSYIGHKTTCCVGNSVHGLALRHPLIFIVQDNNSYVALGNGAPCIM